MSEDFTRRRVLRGTGSAIGVGLVAGTAAGKSETSRPRGTGEVIVGTASRKAMDVAKARADSVSRVHEFGPFGEAIAGKWPDAALDALAKRPDVRYIEPNGLMEASGHDSRGNQSIPWGVGRVDAVLAQHQGFAGQGSDIAILDTGIDSDHPDLQGNLGGGRAYVECGSQYDGSPCSSTNGNACLEPWDDDDDHGTHVAGTADAANNTEGVVGVATSATLHAVKVLDCNGVGTFSDIAAGVQYVADRGWDVANMSLGASSGSQTLHDACKYAYREGVTLVAAAGNTGPCSDCVNFPAAYREVIAVSATARDDTLADFSSTGPEIELAAPGRDIRSTVPGGYTSFSGTSMASPHVAGAAALLAAIGYPNASDVAYNSNGRLTNASYDEPGGARERLRKTAENVGLSASESGSGLLDVKTTVSIGELGTVSVDQPDGGTWRTVTLDNWYEDPVVVMKPVSANGGQPAHVRLRDVANERFEFQVEEWEYLNGSHNRETMFYLVVESGSYVDGNGDRIEARTVRRDEEFTWGPFSQEFADAPVVFSQAQTRNGGQPIVTRQRAVSTSGFGLRVQEEEANGPHATEEVGYIAVESGTNVISGTQFEVGRTPNTVTDEWHRIGFGENYDSPLFVADAQSQDGPDTAELRYRNLTGTGVEVRVEEEQSADPETNHTTETVGYAVVENSGLV